MSTTREPKNDRQRARIESAAKRTRKAEADRRRAGICFLCSEPAVIVNRVQQLYCAVHREKNRAREANRRAALGSPVEDPQRWVRWSREEHTRMEEMRKAGKTPFEIASALRRTVAAVISRIRLFERRASMSMHVASASRSRSGIEGPEG